MSPTHPMYAEIARLELDQRLREADHARRRRLARQSGSAAHRSSFSRMLRLVRHPAILPVRREAISDIVDS